jgi:replicative DNA helicase
MKTETNFTRQDNRQETPKPLPKNDAAEKAAISILCQDWRLLNSTWQDDLFHNPAHQLILRTIRACKNQQKPNGDLFALQAMLEDNGKLDQVGGPAYLTEVFIAYPAPSAGILLHYRQDLAKARAYRKALAVTTTNERDIATGQADLASIASELLAASDDDMPVATFKDQLAAFVSKLESQEAPERFSFGIYGLDSMVLKGGIERKSLAVVAAETSGGKSILLLQLALESALNGKSVAIYSLEMSADQVINRMACCAGRCQILRPDEIKTSAEIASIRNAITKLDGLKIHIRDNISTIEDIEADIADLKASIGVDLVVVDYIQLASSSTKGRNDNREQQVSEVCRKLKLISLSHNIAVATASQLNDDGLLRESRAIGMHADYVLLILHDAGKTSIVTKKNRNGERDKSTSARMIGSQFRFEWEPMP